MRSLVVCMIGAVMCMVAQVNSSEQVNPKRVVAALIPRAEALFAKLDLDSNKALSTDEMRRFSGKNMAVLKSYLELSKQEAQELLRRYDQNEDLIFSQSDVDKLFQEADFDGDEIITEEELLKHMIAMAKSAHEAAGVKTDDDAHHDGTITDPSKAQAH